LIAASSVSRAADAASVPAKRADRRASPALRLDTRRSSPPFSFTNRTRLGVGDWSLWCEPKPEPETVQRLVAEPVAGLLREHSGDGLFQAVMWWGTLVVRRNGFLRPDGLDELARAAGVIAERVRAVCGSLAEPKPFETRLPPPPANGARDLPPGFHPGEAWRTRAVEVAERHGLALEDPFAYHRAFPALPVPGTAYLVMRGEVPYVGQGRLAVHRERDAARPAVVTAAPTGWLNPAPGWPGRARRPAGTRKPALLRPPRRRRTGG
jgi:hypothetical protein